VTGEAVSRNVNPGQYVQPGQALMAVVPLNDVWVTANFKETQIRGMKPGQRADIEVDTYSGRHFRGRVRGIGAASGEKLSLLPPENATGNFVKVVQRIPVRIVFDQPIPKGVVFRPGQNVIATVHVR
jgi:membrane fusion protein, multidrug efflux system